MYTGKSLADGQLPSSKGTLYTVPTGKRAIVRTFVVFNTGSTAETVSIYVSRGTSSRQIGQAVLAANEAAQFFESEPITLSSGDILEGDTTTGSTVDYLITGADEG